MQPARVARRRSAETKLTEEEYGRIERLAAGCGLTVGEWVRESLLAIAGGERPAASPIEQALLAEVLALRTILVNLVYELASGQAVGAEPMGELIGKADPPSPERQREIPPRRREEPGPRWAVAPSDQVSGRFDDDNRDFTTAGRRLPWRQASTITASGATPKYNRNGN